jgi:hypothetical protein
MTYPSPMFSSSYTAAMSKNNLFQAKILELQARIDVGHNPSTSVPPHVRYRSPLVPTDRGAVTYRFEQTPRPVSAREHASGAMTARDRDVQGGGARRAAPPRPAGVSRLMLGAKDGAPPRRRPGPVLPAATATANPRSVDRVFRELRRSQQPAQPHPDSARRSERSTLRADDDDFEAAAGAGVEELEEDARQGRVGKASPMTVEIVYCVDSAQRSLAVKLKPERYRQAALVRACERE